MSPSVFWAEWYKLRRSKLWVFLILFSILPVIYGVGIHSLIIVDTYSYETENQWYMLFMTVVLFYGPIFFPIISALTSRLLNQIELDAANWGKLQLAPVSYTNIYMTKWSWMTILLLATQTLTFLFIINGGYLTGIQDRLPWTVFVSMFALGTLGVLALGTMQLYLFMRSKSTTVTLTVNICLVFPAFLIFTNESGSLLPYFYPWALPVIGMTETTSGGTNLWMFVSICLTLMIVFMILGRRQLKEREDKHG